MYVYERLCVCVLEYVSAGVSVCVCLYMLVCVCGKNSSTKIHTHKKIHNSLNYADEPYQNINELRKKTYNNYMRLLVIELNQWLCVAL